MKLEIDHPCPQCGGPVTLEETDRVLSCPYCRTRLHMTSRGPFRYCIVPERPGRQTLYYLPYWRFKGILYSVIPYKIKPQLVDTTLVAAPLHFVPISMGVRTQVLSLKFATKPVAGVFAGPRRPFEEALTSMEGQLRTIRVLAPNEDTLEKAYIGETASLIFAPFTVRNKTVYDAILDQAVGELPEGAESLEQVIASSHHWSPTFLPAQCPYCGWDLEGTKDSVVFVCRNCVSLWAPKGRSFSRVPARVYPGGGPDFTYVPLWRITAEVDGVELATYADLIRVANLPRAATDRDRRTPFSFWVPAFKINPNIFLRLLRQLNVAPFENDLEEDLPGPRSVCVNLPLAEAAQCLKLALASVGKPKRRMYDGLPSVGITPARGSLVFVPCRDMGAEYVQPDLGFAISRQALIHGKNL